MLIFLIGFLASFAIAFSFFPMVLRFALRKNIVDNPNARKLQRRPIPVLGGVAVFAGLLVALLIALFNDRFMELLIIYPALLVMLIIGVWDDAKGVSAWLRLLVELAVVWGLITASGCSINDYHGCFALFWVEPLYAVPITLFAMVGIINAINLIDGVDGLSSGFCILAAMIFGGVFAYVGEYAMAMLATVTVASLIPFFLHNVFGSSSKMFIGDGGTLVLGLIMAIFVVKLLDYNSLSSICLRGHCALAPFALAILSVPVFDTLRVMIKRIAKGISPFHPDKTHLHHIFIALGVSHAVTTLMVLSLNVLVVVSWGVAWLLGASANVQLIVVVGVSLLVTLGIYEFGAYHLAHDTKLLHKLQSIASKTHIKQTSLFCSLRHFIDRFA